MDSKINITRILKDHIKTLVNQNDNKPGLDDIGVFLLVPLVVSIGLVYYFDFDFYKADSMKKTLISSLAIFVGLLFNSLVMLIGIARNSKNESIVHEVILELISNISYSIIIAFVSVILVLSRFWELPLVGQYIDVLSLFLLTSFYLTFLMIMKRAYLIIKRDVSV